MVGRAPVGKLLDTTGGTVLTRVGGYVTVAATPLLVMVLTTGDAVPYGLDV